jgi:hypothetical protein
MQYTTGQATDKQFLRSIAENNYELPHDIDTYDFAKALLANLSSPDGELRDELSYMILASGIIDKDALTTEQMNELLTTALDTQHLFYAIGEVNTDSVFMRSFSNLIVAAILYTNARNPVIAEQVVRHTKTALLAYTEQEKDWRGYVEGKGWAQAMAHLADALDEVAQNQYMTSEDRQDILQTLRRLAQLAEPLYHEEDMRLATSAQHIIIGKQVPDTFVSDWLELCFVERGSDVNAWMSATNVKNFLRSLYFLLIWDNMLPPVSAQISDILKRLDDVYIQIADGR